MLLKAIVPNLDRRTERWNPCYDKLIQLSHFPPSKVQRFSAFDYKEYKTLSSAKEHATQYFGALPTFLAKEVGVSELCWLFTWYAMIDHISGQSPCQYYMMLVDDCHVTMEYNQLRYSIDLFNDTRHLAAIIQISRNPKRLRCGRLFEALDIWQYGLCGRTDAGVIVNSIGAKILMDTVNKLSFCPVPAAALEFLSEQACQKGFYSLSAKFESVNGGELGAVKEFVIPQDRFASTRGYDK